MKLWVYNLNYCCEIVECLEAIKDKFSTNNMHNEEKKSGISHDQVDQDILRKKWKFQLISLMPLSMDELVNVFTGKINNDLTVTVDDSILLGEDQMKNFQKSLPGGFYDTI